MASGTANFKRILKVLDAWPIDKNKVGGRDLGEFLREYVNKAYKENKFETNYKYWDAQFIALKKLVDNTNKNKYPRVLSSSATGLTAEQCNIALSSEFLQEVNEEEKGFFKKLFSLGPDKDQKKLCTIEKNTVPPAPHLPVMLNEVVNYLKPEENQVILDMTFGAGGHSREILKSAKNIKLLTLDRDPVAIQNYASKLAEEYPEQVVPLLGKFSDLPALLKIHKIRQNSIDGILCDFGCSSMQFDTPERGFSLSKNGPLDMRMDTDSNTPTAAEVLAKATEEDIYKIIKYYGEEKQARKIARAIIDARYLFKKLTTTEELADLVQSVCEDDFRQDKLQRKTHVATKTFQALRIFVNNELNEINYALVVAHRYLKIGGRLVTLTFHSLEDTIVKRHLLGNVIKNSANPLPLKYCSHSILPGDQLSDLTESNWKILTKHVLIPKYDEIEENPRSRSAKMRAAVKIN